MSNKNIIMKWYRIFILIGCVISIWNTLFVFVYRLQRNDNDSNSNNDNNNIPSNKQNFIVRNASLSYDDELLPNISVSEHTFRKKQASLLVSANTENDSTSSASAACLLVMDDNHYFIEWLAYHYHVMNLRHVVVAIDPYSTTSPIPIIQRWKHHMNITIWYNYTDYYNVNTTMISLAQERVRKVLQNSQKKRNKKSTTSSSATTKVNEQLVQHRARQRLFYASCMKYIKKEVQHENTNTKWTMFIDTDEFISINYPVLPTLRPLYTTTTTTIGNQNIHVPSISEPGSVLQLLQLEQQYYSNSTINTITSSPCIQIPRLRYGAMEWKTKINDRTSNRNIANNHFNTSHLATIRWQIHAQYDNYNMNRISKTIIDLSRIPYDTFLSNIMEVDSIHKPIASINNNLTTQDSSNINHHQHTKYCTQKHLHIRSTQQILVLHHYLGTYEQYMSRTNDSRLGNERSNTMYEKVAKINQTIASITLEPWLEGFIRVHGVEQAKKLLNNVGVVEKR